VKIIRTIADLVPSKLGDFAPWREEFPTPSASSFQIICAGRVNLELRDPRAKTLDPANVVE
jgi:hypothetical protein